MTLPPGIRLEQSTTRFQRFFRHWGAKANLRGVFNFVQPVAVVDRSYGPDEGALRGLTGESLGAPVEFPAVFFGGLPDADGIIRVDMFLHALKAWKTTAGFNLPGGYPDEFHLFTPEFPYDPVVNLNPVGLFVPGLNLDDPLSRGRVGMLGGSNPALSRTGLEFIFVAPSSDLFIGSLLPFGVGRFTADTPDPPGGFQVFDPPLRIPAGSGVSVQWRHRGAPAFETLGLRCSILYHERALSD